MIQLLSYSVLGVLSNSIGYMIYLFFTYLGVTPKVTMSLLYSVGAIIGFIGNHKVTFRHQENLLGTGVRYAIAQFLGYCMNFSILIVLVDKFKYNHQWVQGIAILIVAGFLFFACKYFVFRKFNHKKWSFE
jgi:putative flippase GtrA